MLTATAESRLLLRAELQHAGVCTVTHTLGLDADAVVLAVDEPPPVGARVEVRLSFPRLVAPVTVTGVVASHGGSSGPGDPPSVRVSLSGATAEQRARLAALMARAPAAASPAPAPHFRVLVVEDNTMICDMFTYAVRKFFRQRQSPFEVDLAHDGGQAWDMLRTKSYDLAIVDVYLPVMGGDQLIARVRRDRSLAALPIVAISVGGADAREASLSAGADLFLHKPLVLRDLLATLDHLTALRSEP